MLKVGIRGAGFMARRIAETVSRMEGEFSLYSICETYCPKNALVLQREFGFIRVLTSVDDFLSDPELDLVYIAMTNQFHKREALACIRHGKPALVEKPFCLNEDDAREVFDAARQAGVLVSEATWSCYAPARWLVDDLVFSGIVGQVTHARICMANDVYIRHHARMSSLEFGGGALLDFSAYTIGSMVMAHFGTDVELVDASLSLSDEGVDVSGRFVLACPGGVTALIEHDSSRSAPYAKYGVYEATRGYVEVDGTSNVTAARAYTLDGKLIQEAMIPEMISGYEYEFRSMARAIGQGALECWEMPHEMTLAQLRLTDQVRSLFGIKFPAC